MLGRILLTRAEDNRTAYQIALAAVHIDSALLLATSGAGQGG